MGDNNFTIGDQLGGNQEIIDGFVDEAKAYLSSVGGYLHNLEEQKDNPDQELMDKVFRAVHSVKGAAGFLGLDNMGDLAYVMETMLSRMRAGKLHPQSKHIDALLAGANLLTTMLNDIKLSNEVDISSVHDRLSRQLGETIKGKTD